MEFTRREQIMITLLIVLIIAVSGVVFWSKEKPNAVVTPPPSIPEQNKEPVKHQNIIVYITGEVKHPGVVSMAHGSRVIDAVNLLGGPTEMANLQGVNLAAPIADGQQIHIPGKDEAGKGTITTHAPGGKININTADVTDLDTLPGIGPSTAQKIIDYRNSNGSFSSLEELKNVPGIGESKYRNLKEKICL